MAIPDVMPWWEAPDVPDDEDEGEQYADMPDVVAEEVLAGIHPPSGVGSKLAYNAVAISYVSCRSSDPHTDPSVSPTFIRFYHPAYRLYRLGIVPRKGYPQMTSKPTSPPSSLSWRIKSQQFGTHQPGKPTRRYGRS